MARISLTAAVAALADRDLAFADLVAKAGPYRHRPRDPDGPFGALVRAIVFQQLAGKAAAAIHSRMRALVDGPLEPAAIIVLSEEALRGAGLSAAKAASVRDLAEQVHDGRVPLHDVRRIGDDDLIERLTTVRGIGRWTAEMFLLFELRRPDVWPVDDLGVRQGYALGWHLPTPPKPAELAVLGEPYRPHRSIVAAYCWQAVALHRAGVAL